MNAYYFFDGHRTNSDFFCWMCRAAVRDAATAAPLALVVIWGFSDTPVSWGSKVCAYRLYYAGRHLVRLAAACLWLRSSVECTRKSQRVHVDKHVI